MQVTPKLVGGAVRVDLTDLSTAEFDTVLRSLRRMQVSGRRRTFYGAKATMTAAHKQRARAMHEQLAGSAV